MHHDGGGRGSGPIGATEMPVRVEPTHGAVVAPFPWAAARAAVAALNDARSTLGQQLETRVGMDATLTEWAGGFRNEFDGTNSRITGAVGPLRDALGRKAAAIVDAAYDANEQQRENNTRAEQQLVEPTGRWGGGVPV